MRFQICISVFICFKFEVVWAKMLEYRQMLFYYYHSQFSDLSGTYKLNSKQVGQFFKKNCSWLPWPCLFLKKCSYQSKPCRTGGDQTANPSGRWRSHSASPCPRWPRSGGAPSGAGPALEAQTDKRGSDSQGYKNSFKFYYTFLGKKIFRSIKTMA